MIAFGRGLRRLLDGLYLACGMIAALALVSILAIIVAQMIARWTGLIFPGAASYAGYAMATASFFAGDSSEGVFIAAPPSAASPAPSCAGRSSRPP